MEASDWKGLHPASVVVNLLPTAWRALRSLWPLLLALFIGGAQRPSSLFDVLLIGSLLVLPIGRTIVHWATLRYRVDNGHLTIQTGLLNRQVRTIPPERIQNVELVRNVFHRMSGLVELRVETASGTDIEGLLSALSVAEAEDVLQRLAEARSQARPTTEEAPPPPLLTNGPGELLKYGLSTTRLGLVLVVLGIGYELVLTDVTRMESFWQVLGTGGAFVALLALVLGAWLVGAATALVRHWDYRLTAIGGRLVAEEGLFTRRRVELPLRKVQLVMLREPVVRRLLGFGSVHIETAAAREEGGGTQRAEAVVPVVETRALSTVLRHAVPEAPDVHTLSFTPPHPRALIRAWISGSITMALLATGASWLFWPLGLLAWALVPLDVLQSLLDHRHQGWWMDDRFLVSRTGWFVRRTRIVSLERLQSVDVAQGPLARRWDLARLRVRVAGNGVELPVLSWEDALDLEVALVRASVLLGAPRGQELPPALDHDQEAGGEQKPGDGLDHDAHQQQHQEEQPPPVGDAPVVADGPGHHHRADRDLAEREHHQHEAERMRLAVEPDLPDQPQAGLDHRDDPLESEHEPERDQHAGHHDPQS
jgi:putative membrane protein